MRSVAIRRVSIESLAPTGEGIARSPEGVGFVAGALPGEEVEAEVLEVRKRFWKGRAVSIANSSPARLSGPHAEGCPACDWAHVDPEVARRAKRELFRETMERIGELPQAAFGELPISPSPSGYRLRSRFHVSGTGSTTAVGFYAPRTHLVEPAEACEALSPEMRALLPRLLESIGRSGTEVFEIATVESRDGKRRLARATLAAGQDRSAANRLLSSLEPLFDGVTVREGTAGRSVVARAGAGRLEISVGGREFLATPDVFFQANRYLVEDLYRDVAAEARAVPPGRALDGFAGVGLFAGALLDAGHAVSSVEGDGAAVELAREAQRRRPRDTWSIEHSAVLPFAARVEVPFDLAVVDPPRAGLGLRLAAALPRAASRILYVSCDPATLARDLAALVAGGLEIRRARLYDFFAMTHRVEAAVTLEAPART